MLELKPINNETLNELLNGADFLEIRKGQLLFRENGHHVLFNIKEDHIYSAEEYFSLPEGIPYQLLNGKLTFMPAPSIKHQRILRELFFEICLFLKANKCGEALCAPTDVYFNEENVAQPDILFVANKNLDIISDKSVNGVPDFIVEILSGNKKTDRVTKMKLYGEQGVKEFWLIDPELKTLEVYKSELQKMQIHEIYEEHQEVHSLVIKDFSIQLNQLFK